MTKQRGYYTLEIGGKKRTLHFSMNFWANFTDLLNISLAEIGDVFSDGISIKGLRTLIYSGLLAYDQENKKEIVFPESSIKKGYGFKFAEALEIPIITKPDSFF